MSDFRFKISGDSSPFLAELYNAATCSLVSSQVVEYSGLSTSYCNHTCVIFDGLNENTCYYAKIIDNIGNIAYSCTGSTPTNPVVIPIEIDVNLLGTCCSPATCVCVLDEPKYICITPAPTGSQCIDITLSGYSCNGTTDQAYVEVFKRCGISGSYSSVGLLENCSNVINVSIEENDDVCYEMITVLDHNCSCQCLSYACTYLCIDNITPVNYGTCCNINTTFDELCITQSICTTTTTTSTTLAPVIVYFDNINIANDSLTYTQCGTANLATFPAIGSGQSFRVCFELVNRYQICSVTLPRQIAQYGSVKNGATVVEELSTFGQSPANCTFTADGYIDVNSGNIADVCICSRVMSHVTNEGCDFSEYQCIRICNITNMVGGNYTYGQPGYPSCIRTEWQDWFTGEGELRGDIV